MATYYDAYYATSQLRRDDRDKYDKVYRKWGDGAIRSMTCIFDGVQAVTTADTLEMMILPKDVTIVDANLTHGAATTSDLDITVSDGTTTYHIVEAYDATSAGNKWAELELASGTTCLGESTGKNDFVVSLDPQTGNWGAAEPFKLTVLYTNDDDVR